MTTAATVVMLHTLKICRTHKYVHEAWTLTSGIFGGIFFLLFVKSIHPTACFKCVNTQRGVVEQRHHYFCRTVITVVTFFFKEKKEKKTKKYGALPWMALRRSSEQKEELVISYSLIGYLSLYSTSILCCPLKFSVTSKGKRDNIFPLFSLGLGIDPLSKVSLDWTANKKQKIKMSTNYKSQSGVTEYYKISFHPPIMHPLLSINCQCSEPFYCICVTERMSVWRSVYGLVHCC